MKKTKSNGIKAGRRYLLTFLLLCCVALASFSLALACNNAGYGKPDQPVDSAKNQLQSLIDSLYVDICLYPDAKHELSEARSRKEGAQKKVDELGSRVKETMDFNLDTICKRPAGKEAEGNMREFLASTYRKIFQLEGEKALLLKTIDSSEVFIKNLEGKIGSLEKKSGQSKSVLTKAIENMEGFGVIIVRGHRYRYFIAKLQAVDVRIHNNSKRPDPQTFRNVQEQLRKKASAALMITNGGMYMPDFSPQGLLIEEYKEFRKIDTGNKDGLNFYLQPNGVFYIDSSGYHVAATDEYVKIKKKEAIRYATQSGPMLVSNGNRNRVFKKQSSNLNIRNGVGMIDPKKIVFVISDDKVNFYEFASVFEDIFNCRNALYLDGVISKMYTADQPNSKMPIDADGNFGPVISVSKKK